MMNTVNLMGRLTRDPEVRYANTGTMCVSFTVACERDFKKDASEKETDFIDCVAFKNTGEFISKYFKKGSAIVVVGRLQIRNWKDKEGNSRRTAEVVVNNAYFGETKRSGGSDSSSSESYEQTFTEIPDDGELPF